VIFNDSLARLISGKSAHHQGSDCLIVSRGPDNFHRLSALLIINRGCGLPGSLSRGAEREGPIDYQEHESSMSVG
jgi:hypothetical protein